MLRQVALDTETTGKSDDGTPGDHRIIEIGCVEIIDRRITGRTLQFYLDPEREIDEGATKVHGYTWDMLKGKPKFKDIAAEFIDFIRGSELLIHNARFDTSFMDSEFKRMHLTEMTKDIATITDTVTLALNLHPGHQVNLDNLCNIFGVNNKDRTLHGALLDARLLAEVYLAMTGGQKGFDLRMESNSTHTKRWQRPHGYRLPLMQVSSKEQAKHVSTMLALAQNTPLKMPPVPEGAQAPKPLCGSSWGDEYTMELLEKSKEESKGDFKKRQQAQKQEALNRMLSETQLHELDELEAEDKDAYQEWEDRVMGRAPQIPDPFIHAFDHLLKK